MHLATGQLPEQPAIDGAERQLTRLGARPGAGDIIQQPGQFGGGKIGIQQQAGLVPHHVFMASIPQTLTCRGGAPVLPDNGLGKWIPGLAIPQHGGFPLVGDANGRQLPGFQMGIAQGLLTQRQGIVPDLHGIVFHPAVMGKMLAELFLRLTAGPATAVEHNGAGTGGALVNGKDVRHGSANPVISIGGWIRQTIPGNVSGNAFYMKT